MQLVPKLISVPYSPPVCLSMAVWWGTDDSWQCWCPCHQAAVGLHPSDGGQLACILPQCYVSRDTNPTSRYSKGKY